ncbi:MAG: phytanoyl-CoA dioxygenase family protein [Acidimicrobiales bacterium]
MIDADRLAATGRLVEAVDMLAAAYRTTADPALAVRLVDLRQQAARSFVRGPGGRSPWPPAYGDPYRDVSGRLPEVGVAELTTDVLGGAVAHHGAMIVRGMFDDAQLRRTLDAIHQVQAWRDKGPAEAAASGWYRPIATDSGMTEALRQRAAAAGGTWLADSPVAAATILDDLASLGVIDVITRHMGERPCFSLQKSTLRRVPPKENLATWHQDGSFLDADVRSMNVWIALSRCGGDYPSPGLEVIPRRIPELLPVQDSLSPFSVSFEMIGEIASETPAIRPEFGPGDALMFDERFLHRTYLDHVMTEPRYALECWFFAPSHSPSSYIPFLV